MWAAIAAAAIAGPQDAIMRSLLSYQRAQEEQADRAGVKFLTATGQSAKGMYVTFKRFADQGLFSLRGADPYVQSHPMPAERVAALEVIAKTSPYWEKLDSPELQLRHDLMRAKLYGFMERPDTVARRYPANDTSLPARYARAISTYRHADLRTAVGPNRWPHPGAAEQPLFPRAQGPGFAGRRPAGGSDRLAAACSPARAAAGLDPGSACARR